MIRRVGVIGAVMVAGMVHAAPVDDAARAMNEYRDGKRRATLDASDALTRAAQAHAADMLAQTYFSHTSKDGSTFTDRIKAQGFKACFAAENIAFGATSGAAAIEQWINSPPHKRNMLHRKAEEYGLGQAGKYWVMVLAAPC